MGAGWWGKVTMKGHLPPKSSFKCKTFYILIVAVAAWQMTAKVTTLHLQWAQLIICKLFHCHLISWLETTQKRELFLDNGPCSHSLACLPSYTLLFSSAVLCITGGWTFQALPRPASWLITSNEWIANGRNWWMSSQRRWRSQSPFSFFFCVVCGGFSNQLHLFLLHQPQHAGSQQFQDPGSVLVTSPLSLCPSHKGEMGPASCWCEFLSCLSSLFAFVSSSVTCITSFLYYVSYILNS